MPSKREEKSALAADQEIVKVSDLKNLPADHSRAQTVKGGRAPERPRIG